MASTIEALSTLTQLASVRLAATGNQTGTYSNGPLNNGIGATFTYASGALVLDTVTVNLNDYVILPFQTLAYENGIYQCTQAGSVGVQAILTRRGDFQCLEQIALGGYVNVYAGSALKGAIYTIIEPAPLSMGPPSVPGANDINFSNGPSGGSGEFLLSANNLSDVGNPATSLSNLSGLPLAGAPIQPGVTGYPVIVKNLTFTAAQFNSGPQTLLSNSGTHQLFVLNTDSPPGGTNFSGGGGDRNLQVTDGTSIFGTMDAAVLQANMNQFNEFDANSLIGFPNTTAGAPIVIQYQGGTANYTVGEIHVTILAVQLD